LVPSLPQKKIITGETGTHLCLIDERKLIFCTELSYANDDVYVPRSVISSSLCVQ